VVSLDAPDGTDPEWVMTRLTKWLAPEVSVRAAAAVPDSFDARRSAKRRVYEYRIYLADAPDPFLDRFALCRRGSLDVRAMRAGAKALVGEHDFSSFCRRSEGSLVRRVRSITIASRDGGLVVRAVADSFCHQMVRSIVGTLLHVGSGDRTPSGVRRILAARDRAAAGHLAPARGLSLVEVTYSPDPFAGRRPGS
jgi:tRNA pseudouridine38-40 synthase